MQPLDLSNLYERVPNLAKNLETHFSNSPYNIIAMYKTKKLPHFKPLQKQTQTLRKTFQNPRKTDNGKKKKKSQSMLVSQTQSPIPYTPFFLLMVALHTTKPEEKAQTAPFI